MKEKIKVFFKFIQLYRLLTKIYDYFNHILGFIKILKLIIKIDPNVEVFFFFPFYHTGGAERVHLDIVSSMKKKSVVFFTLPSANEHFKSKFNSVSTCVELEKFIRKPFQRYIVKYILLKKINFGKNKVVFGCHSMLFYELLSSMNSNVKRIDLIHAFTGPCEPGFEKTSLPYIPLIEKRVVINLKAKNDILNLYEEKKIDSNFNERIQIIPNSTDFTCEVCPIKTENEFKVLYVGRNSPEKRINLLGKIASDLKKVNDKIEIILIGENLIDTIDLADQKACVFLANVDDRDFLAELYSGAHCVIITSSREGFPMVFMEGMTFGCIPVSTDVGGIQEHVLNEETGFLVENTNDDVILIDCFVKLLLKIEQDRMKFEKISLNSHRHAQHNFGKAKFNFSYEQLIQNK